MRLVRFLPFFMLAFIAGCGGVSVLPEPFTRQRVDGKIPVKAELIRQQVRAELGGMLESEAEVARWQTIETDYNQCRLRASEHKNTKQEEVFSDCMSKKGYVYMIPIDAEQFHNDIAFEIRKAKNAAEKAAEEKRIAAEKQAEENRIAAEKRAEEKRIAAKKQAEEERIIWAASNGHAETVKALLGGGANPNAATAGKDGWDGWTALMAAAHNGHTEVVKALLGGGANPNAADKKGWTALIWAAQAGHTEIVKALLGGANPNAVEKDGNTALMAAAKEGHTEVIKALLGGGANPNAANKNGWTALMAAAYHGQAEIAKLLLSAGAITNQLGKNEWTDWTALHQAAQREHSDIAALLLSCGANPNLKYQKKYTAWDWARRNVTVLSVFEEYQWKLDSGWRPQSCKGRWWSPSRSEVGGRIAVGASANPPRNTNIAQTVFEKVWRSIVVIKSGKNQGSGVIVRPNIVATNCHVLGGEKITVYKHDNRRASTDTLFSATVRKRDSKKDFCLLDVSGLSGIPAGIRKYNTLKIGENVYALGSPKGLDLSLSSGLISQLRQGGGERIIQTDAAISPGSSGGGLFDSEGNLIGITTAVHKDADAENVGFAIPADLALGL
ncbi:MAG: trypsin-like serine protease [Betaproteobacteria bacterium]|nr:trypsin-like serine protease [Betaproteobacteria bacterium]